MPNHAFLVATMIHHTTIRALMANVRNIECKRQCRFGIVCRSSCRNMHTEWLAMGIPALADDADAHASNVATP